MCFRWRRKKRLTKKKLKEVNKPVQGCVTDTDHHATSPLFFIEDHLPAEQQYCEQSQELRTAEELSANCPAHSEYYPLIVPKKKGECIVNIFDDPESTLRQVPSLDLDTNTSLVVTTSRLPLLTDSQSEVENCNVKTPPIVR
ncbi:hypothetical protein M3Y97_00543700 [Aphelenchoides bicaudatus]|nr:hypothetical protein M3Y97_00543700 [Aphelenchoides bicaudatus]